MICVRDKFVTLSGTCPGLCRKVGVMEFGLIALFIPTGSCSESETVSVSQHYNLLIILPKTNDSTCSCFLDTGLILFLICGHLLIC